MNTKHLKNELLIILAVVCIAYFTFSHFDVLEMIVLFSSQHEVYEIDELVSASIVLAFCLVIFSIRRWQEILQYNTVLAKQNNELQHVLNQLKVLKGILPTCSYCKKIRNHDGSWEQMESYINTHSEAEFSHSICPDCINIPMEELKKAIRDQPHK